MRRLATLGLAALAACTGSVPPAPDAAPEIDAEEPVDLANAHWELEPVDNAGDSGFSPKMSFDGEGRAVAVWQLNDASAIGFAIREAGGWTVRFISDPSATGNFSPDIAGGDGREAHIVFTATHADTAGDIMYVHWDGASLSVISNLTSGGQGASDSDSSPAIAVTPGGRVSVLYNYTSNPNGFSRQLRALSFTNAGAPGNFATVFDETRNCGSIRALSVDETVHVSVQCRPNGTDEVVYLNNRSGAFTPQNAAFSGTSLVAPDLAVGSDGSVHLVAQTQLPCGDATCTVPTYSKNLSPAIPAAVETESYFNPSIALDSENQPVIVFFELPDRELFWTFGTDGGFFRRQQVTVGGGKLVGTGGTDPVSGLPWFILEDRENSPQIWLARLVP